jgi:hypothetical protein
VRVIGNVPLSSDKAEITAVASGALATGDTVVVNSDGTVSVAAETGSSEVIGTPTVFEAANTVYSNASYDANAQKVVIAYRDGGNSNYGTAVVGTVSGTTISFGTPVVYYSAYMQECVIYYDPDAQKHVIIYYNASGYGEAIVGTVSGTSMTFGSGVVFNAGSVEFLAMTYDTNADKIIIAYRDGGNSDKGTAIVGTVSGTSISFGSEVVFNNYGTSDVALDYDANAQKVLIAYRDNNNSNYGTAIVGTVSGTSISFGTGVVYNSGNTTENQVVYDPSSQKMVIVYRDDANSGKGTAIVGSISGTSVSFGTEVGFETSTYGVYIFFRPAYHAAAQKIVVAYRGNAFVTNYLDYVVGTVSGTSISFTSPSSVNASYSQYMSPIYDPNEEKIVIAYQDVGGSYYGTAVVLQAGYTSTNLTSENFIGFAKHGYADTQRATIQTGGAINKDQTGLTAGQTYYVQTDGSLSTTAGDPSVVAGTAISSTDLIVKG